ncbi:MAG: hypothetical protein A2X86_08255 [Bdellovibrionales bacterium GWA2_49_15]|nr:MAG: hypothetical protein A2X86_08255 [Bdellovibrionales bacterium GWA2_49_15]
MLSLQPFKIPMILMFSVVALLAKAEDLPTFKLLSDRRAEIILPKYTLEEKKLVLDQVQLVLEQLFVHKSLKIDDFGSEADPTPALLKVASEIETLSDVDFHQRLAEIFLNLRDLHTDYKMPVPYSCYRSFIPLSFAETRDPAGKQVLAVSGLATAEEALRLLPAPLKIQVGDILLSYKGMTAEKAVQTMLAKSRGANTKAAQRRAVDLLTYLSHQRLPVPPEDSIQLTFKNRLGKIYHTTLPWISKVNSTCLKNGLEGNKKNEFAEDEYKNEFNKLFRKMTNNKNTHDRGNLVDTAEPILKYALISNEYGNFGYISLESFEPEVLNVDQVVQEVKLLLRNQFAKTDGLIFDIRNNGGGRIALAENLVQLFHPANPVPLNFRLKSSPANQFYFDLVSPNGIFTEALREAARQGSELTKNLPLNSEKKMSELGQYYFRPVAVFNNASCYSSCDMFSAQMQDHGAAIIFGEDENTGAGGANNYTLSEFLQDLPKENTGPFKHLPHGQDIGFSLRQTVRVGLNTGKLIEDVGVIADDLAVSSLSDFFNGNADQLKILSRKLNEMSPAYTSSVIFMQEGRQDIILNQPPSVFAQWENTASVEFKEGDTILGRKNIELDNPEGRELTFPKNMGTDKFKISKVEVSGYNQNSVKVWRKVYQYRVVPENLILAPNQNLVIDLNAGESRPLALYTEHTKENHGWVVENGALKIGNEEKYQNNVHAEAALFVRLPDRSTYHLKFDAVIQTELDYDFFKVLAVSGDKEIVLVDKKSGSIPLQSYEVDLSAFAGKSVELRFVFDSDAGVVDRGVSVSKISISL